MYIHINIFRLCNVHKMYCNIVSCTILLYMYICNIFMQCMYKFMYFKYICVSWYICWGYVSMYVSTHKFLLCRNMHVDKSISNP